MSHRLDVSLIAKKACKMIENFEQNLNVNLRFPLSDGRVLVQGPLTYGQDGLYSTHSCSFVRDQRFIDAYRVGMEGGNPETHIEWRVHVALWCATRALHVPGDFIECGVHTGILSGAIMTWLDFGVQAERSFFLFDTWHGIPEEQISSDERKAGVSSMNRKYANGDVIFEMVERKFSRWDNAQIIRGKVPETLSVFDNRTEIAYLSIDLNVAEAEMKAIEILWPKMSPGGVLLIDDYGWAAHRNQKICWDNWAARHNLMILCLPTGQGVVFK